LGDVFEQTVEYTNPKDDDVELWSLTVENGLTPKTERYNREFLVKKEDTFKAVLPNEFAYNPMNMTLGAVDLNLMKKKVAVSGYYITMRTIENHDNKYFSAWLKSPKSIRLYKLYATGGLLEKQRVQFPTLSQIEATMPLYEEQATIGNFFHTLDKTITLLKRKLDGLKQLKKAYLQQMFPQAGERVPKVRFAGFTGDWEERKLGELANFNPRSVLPDVFVYVDLESVVGTSLISSRIERKETAPSRAQRLAQKGDVFFQMVRPYQMNNYLYDLPHKNYVFSTGYAQLRPKIHSYFLLCKLQEESFVTKVIDRCTGTSYPAINSTDLAEIDIAVAADNHEQTAIGDLFLALDNQLSVQQTKLDNLKHLRSAYLQKMFI